MKNKAKNKIKSIPMWIGILSSAILAVGINWQELTSWEVFGDAFMNFISNPSSIILFIISVFAAINNPDVRKSL